MTRRVYTALVLGKAVSAGVRALSQAAFVYALALVLGVHIRGSPLALLGVVAIMMLGPPCSRPSRSSSPVS